ncbi:hypothetical protein [Alteromonas sp. KUL49]|uniref:hypothetical protein n=1 Tax=Alteromonas sp. KUL49 TaxID=2480798 RepID=UPI00102F03E5|nr:hypothetical protein [Alteromonas sp. KUL49]TAP38763.1 hypothetical protein EYS00_15280 [Alteromonas sp. KUL49]GEA12719.1 hypothetical protein KUL49_30940 [Alteromonas sp. KUL49]
MEPVSIALALAKLAGVDEWLKDKVGGVVSSKVATRVIDIAQQVAGVTSPDEALEKIGENARLASELKIQLMNNEQELRLAAYQDRKDARATYRVHPQQADKLASFIFKFNLPCIIALVIINCVVLHFFRDNAGLLASICNVVGMAIKSLFDERKEVTGFYYGGSMDASEKRHSDG